MRLLTCILFTLWLTACGQSGALYFAEPEKPAKQEEKKKQDAPSPSADSSTDPTGP